MESRSIEITRFKPSIFKIKATLESAQVVVAEVEIVQLCDT